MFLHPRCAVLVAVAVVTRITSASQDVHAVKSKRQDECTSEYRSYDGTCNNVDNPLWGSTQITLLRVLKPVYHNDDGQTPRLKASNGEDLPSPRTVSTVIHDELSFPANRFTSMMMQWGQFLDHDITLTPGNSAPTVPCCNQSGLLDGDLHNDVTTGGVCFPIIVPTGDRTFTSDEERCMEFYRSVGVNVSSTREQRNDNTAWVDGSQVYGHSGDEAVSLRSMSGGKLLMNTIDGNDFLPEHEDSSLCFQVNSSDYCFKAGDKRVNVFPGLTAMHLVFARYHNKLCDRLASIHSDWTDENLYQEARRIVVALLQKITYNDFLPRVIGNTNAENYGLLSDRTLTFEYNSSMNPSLTNVFSTAAFRFGHSMVTESFSIGGQEYATGELYMRPGFVLQSLENVVNSILNEVPERVDRWYTEEITDKMFAEPGKDKGQDIVSLNVQRGRDHGLQPYNAWREAYGLERINDFTDLADNAENRFAQVYTSVEDIDLYSGGVSEDHATGASVGELYVRILGDQFQKMKYGDRFWYENQDTTSGHKVFTQRQIRRINRVRLSKIICDVTEITAIRENPFTVTDAVDCSTLDDLQIESLW